MQPTKQLLMIAYLFPPIGGGGVQRAVKMARYLGDFGWKVHVLTVDPEYHATLDESLLQEIPDDVIIHRCAEDQSFLSKLRPKPPVVATGAQAVDRSQPADRSPADASVQTAGSTQADVRMQPANGSPAVAGTAGEPFPTSQADRRSLTTRFKRGMYTVLKKVKNTVLMPDDQIFWYPAARKKGLDIIRQYGIDAIVSTSGPYTNHLVGRYLKRKTGLPWIADFRDPWTQNMHRSGIRLRDWLEEKMERSVHRHANVTLTVTHSFAQNFNEKFGAAISRLEVIHNGFDPADYTDLANLKKDPEDAERCVWMYAGIFYRERNPRLLLRAVKELIDEGLIDRQRIRLRFAGVFDYPGYRDNADCVQELGLQDIVEVIGNLPHKEALAAMKKSDVLLLVGDTAPDSGNYIPGKLYEYMAIGRPILALSMPGESTKIIEKYGLGEVADPLSLPDIKEKARKMYMAWAEQHEVGLRSSSFSNADEQLTRSGSIGAPEKRSEERSEDRGEERISSKTLGQDSAVLAEGKASAFGVTDGEASSPTDREASSPTDREASSPTDREAFSQPDWKASEEPEKDANRVTKTNPAVEPANQMDKSILKYQRREQARMLAELLNEITGNRR